MSVLFRIQINGFRRNIFNYNNIKLLLLLTCLYEFKVVFKKMGDSFAAYISMDAAFFIALFTAAIYEQ